MTRALGDTAERIADEVRGHRPEVRALEPDAEPDPEHPMADEVRPLRPPGEQPRPPLREVPAARVPRDDPDPRLDDARLVALQMAVAGRSRDEVEAHLRQAFDVRDPEPILDHVFAEGFRPRPESPSGA